MQLDSYSYTLLFLTLRVKLRRLARAIELWRLNRRITQLEKAAKNTRKALQHLELKTLPPLRQRRNDLTFGRKE